MKKIILYTNNYNFETEKKEFLEYHDKKECTDDEVYNWINDIQETDYDNIKDELKTLPNNLIAIADVGLWYGTRKGYKLINNDEILSLVSNCDYIDVYIEGNDLKIKGDHHDGTNYITIRQLKDISDTIQDRLESSIYNNSNCLYYIKKYTKSIGKKILNKGDK